jgi:hypothetical protein
MTQFGWERAMQPANLPPRVEPDFIEEKRAKLAEERRREKWKS